MLVILIALQLLYFPINQVVKGGVSTLLPIDNYIKLTPIWAVPYLLSIYWWVGSIAWAAYKVEFKQFAQFFICLSLAILLSYIIFLVYPTYVTRPQVSGADIFSKLIIFIYGNDRSYNVLPSNHTYTTLIISIFWSRWYPKWRALWIIFAIVVILSTLFTKQHAILDVIAASILVVVCYGLSGFLIPKIRNLV
jgi:membrane-associated phospholipid phosphatase